MVYFMQATDGGPIKIGHSDDVDRRRRQLETHYRKPLALLATMPGGREEEAAIHERFVHLRLGATEQFRPAFEIMQFIDRPLLASPNADAARPMKPAKVHIGLGIRVSVGWADWLSRAAEHSGLSVGDFIEQAAHQYARSRGIRRKPPKR